LKGVFPRYIQLG